MTSLVGRRRVLKNLRFYSDRINKNDKIITNAKLFRNAKLLSDLPFFPKPFKKPKNKNSSSPLKPFKKIKIQNY